MSYQDILEWAVAILGVLCLILVVLYNSEKGVYKETFNKCVESWKENKELKKQIEDLEKQLKLYKDNERIIKIEQVHLEPRELECTFAVMPHFVDDTETFKKIVISETARYLAEELERDPFLCKIYHSLNTFDCSEKIKVRFRMLPYPEGVVWDDIFKKEEEE